MKLKKLLKVIPDEYNIGITSADNEVSIITYGTKEEAVTIFAQRTTTTPDFVESLEVAAIHPCARTYCADESIYGNGMPSFYVCTRLLIEVNLKEAEQNERSIKTHEDLGSTKSGRRG